MPRFSWRQWAIFIGLAVAATAGGFVFGRRILNPAPAADVSEPEPSGPQR